MPVRVLQSYNRVSVVQTVRWSEGVVQNYTWDAVNRRQRFLPPTMRERGQSTVPHGELRDMKRLLLERA